MNIKRNSIIALTLMSLAGCSTPLAKREGDAINASHKAKVDEAMVQLESNAKKQSVRFKKIDGNWISAKSIKIDNATKLPDSFYKNWTFKLPGRVNLTTAAARINKITGVPVRVKVDSFMTQASFAGNIKVEDSKENGQNRTSDNVTDIYVRDLSTDVDMNFSGTLEEFLNKVAISAGVNWEYKNGTVEFYKMVSRSFDIKVNPGDVNFSSNIGKSAGEASSSAEKTGASGFSGGSTVAHVANIRFWSSFESSIKAILSPNGKFSINQGTGTLVVMDSKDVVDEVAKFVEHENTMLSRQVRLRVEVFNVTLGKEYARGVDWSLVQNSFRNAVGGVIKDAALTLTSPATLVDGVAAGGLGLSIVSPIGEGKLGAISGSKAMINALNKVGNASVLNTTNAITINRQPVPVSITNQVSYVAATTPAVGAVGGTVSAPGLTPGVVTTGFVLNMLPTISDDGKIMLHLGIDMSELTRLNVFTSGQGASAQSIQTPEVASTQFLQKASIRSGETLILSGFERNRAEYNKTNIVEDGDNVFGGSYGGTTRREATVIMITPVIEDL